MTTILIGIAVLLIVVSIICLVIERKTIEKLVTDEIKRLESLIKGDISKDIEFIKKDIDVLFERLHAVKKSIEPDTTKK